jgi:hypothetical protein
VKTIRPDKPDPIAARQTSSGMGTIILRFGLLLGIAAGLLVFIWYR